MALTGNINFNQVTLNVGNGMSSEGFVAPMAGHYKMYFLARGESWYSGGSNTYVLISKNGQFEFNIGHSNDGKLRYGNNVSDGWIIFLKKGDKVTLQVDRGSNIRADSWWPVNFNGELVFAEPLIAG